MMNQPPGVVGLSPVLDNDDSNKTELLSFHEEAPRFEETNISLQQAALQVHGSFLVYRFSYVHHFDTTWNTPIL